MIGENDELNKSSETPKRKKKFFFPLQQRTVEASSRVEAESIINKEKTN